LSDAELEQILATGDVIKNWLKVLSVRKNAIAFFEIQKEVGSFIELLWRYVNGKPKVNVLSKSVVTSLVSDTISKRVE